MIKVLLADDHPVVLKGIKQILAESRDIIIEGSASCGQDLLSLLSQIDVDVIIMDISMPGLNGLDLLHEIKTKYRNTPVLILSIYPEEQYGVRMIKGGADGYLPKNSAPTELINAVHKISQGHQYITQALAERLATHLQMRHSPSIENLSDREYQVFVLLAKGTKTRHIAEQLCLSSKTVDTYRTRIIEKMGFEGTSDLIRYAIENNIA